MAGTSIICILENSECTCEKEKAVYREWIVYELSLVTWVRWVRWVTRLYRLCGLTADGPLTREQTAPIRGLLSFLYPLRSSLFALSILFSMHLSFFVCSRILAIFILHSPDSRQLMHAKYPGFFISLYFFYHILRLTLIIIISNNKLSLGLDNISI